MLATSREVLTIIFVEELEAPARVFNCLKQAGIHAINDFLNYIQDDLGSISLRAMNLISLDVIKRTIQHWPIQVSSSIKIQKLSKISQPSRNCSYKNYGANDNIELAFSY